MALAAASLYAEEGYGETACAIVADLRSDLDLRPRVEAVLATSSHIDWDPLCKLS
jgi:hypothetical protein